MQPKRLVVILSIAVLTCAILAGLVFHFAHRRASLNPSRSDWQIQQSLNQELKDPKFRALYLAHQRFLDLFQKMPTFDQANFGPRFKTVYWRSVKWRIFSVYESYDGSEYVRLGYAQGPGTDQYYTTRLIDGKYVGRENLGWNALLIDPRRSQRMASANRLPIACRDVRARSAEFAAIPSASGGPTLTKSELSAVSEGDSNLPSVVLACYQFDGMNIIELVAGNGVLFRADGRHVTPLVRGYIAYADPGGRFMIIQSDAGYEDKTDWPLTDYLEVFPFRP
jgi:hypothetical protein